MNPESDKRSELELYTLTSTAHKCYVKPQGRRKGEESPGFLVCSDLSAELRVVYINAYSTYPLRCWIRISSLTCQIRPLDFPPKTAQPMMPLISVNGNPFLQHLRPKAWEFPDASLSHPTYKRSRNPASSTFNICPESHYFSHLCWHPCSKPHRLSPGWSAHLDGLLTSLPTELFTQVWSWSLLCSEPSHGSPFHSVKAHNSFQRPCTILSSFPIGPHLLSVSTSFTLLQITLIFLLFFILSGHVSASGPLQLLFPLTGTLFPQVSAWLIPSPPSNICSNIACLPCQHSLFLIFSVLCITFYHSIFCWF